MQFFAILDEIDTRQAVAEWLMKHHSIYVHPEQIEPVTKTEVEGEYDETTQITTQIGWRVKPEVMATVLERRQKDLQQLRRSQNRTAKSTEETSGTLASTRE